MLGYVLRRLLVAIPTVLAIVTIAFFMMRAAPGNPFDTDRPMPEEIRQRVLAAYNLDQPIHIQYIHYMGDLLRGDFGPSLKYRDKDVIDILAEGAPTSATIGASSLILAILVGGVLGSVAALRQNRPSDFAVMAVALVGISIPPFVVGPLLQLFVGVQLDWLPTSSLDPTQPLWLTLGGSGVPVLGQIPILRNLGVPNPAQYNHLVLPVITLALPQIAIVSRLMRASMIEVISSNYIRTARAKGLSHLRVITRHALRAALPPLVSYIGPASAALVTGSLVIEQVFQLPGIGRQFVIGALQRDYTVVMGVVVLYATLIIVMNLLADIALAALDPKVRLR